MHMDDHEADDGHPGRRDWKHEPYRNSLELYESMQDYIVVGTPMSTETSDLAKNLSEAIQAIEAALRIYKVERIFLAFNGGKDASVLTHLYRAVLANMYRQDIDTCARRRLRPRTVFFDSGDEFDEIRDFVKQQHQEFDLNFTILEESYITGIHKLLQRERAEGGEGFAFILGTRCTDAKAEAADGIYTPSSSWLPPFMRVRPILNWELGCIWKFLLHFRLPYCPLYDEGYSSLGTKYNTVKNPALYRNGIYLPAYELGDWKLERDGRVVISMPAMASCGGSESASETDKSHSVIEEAETTPSAAHQKVRHSTLRRQSSAPSYDPEVARYRRAVRCRQAQSLA